MYKLSKLASDGTDLPPDAADHTAVRVKHPLLAKPIIVTARHAPKAMTWKKAAGWAAKLDLNGWQWRLPTIEEAIFIPDRSKFPAADKTFFPDLEDYEWIWTSTPDTESPSDCAWFVLLRNGYVIRYYQSSQSHVRAVRAGQF